MADSDFTFDRARRDLGLTIRSASLFPDLAPIEPPTWLVETLRRNREIPYGNERSRDEVFVSPILTAASELAGKTFTVFSGLNMDGDPTRGLSGPCDFLLAQCPPLPMLSEPFLTTVQPKEADLSLGYGPCAAQMAGARLFNERDGIRVPSFGAVTTGELWQFLRLDGDLLRIDPRTVMLPELGLILAALLAATAP